ACGAVDAVELVSSQVRDGGSPHAAFVLESTDWRAKRRSNAVGDAPVTAGLRVAPAEGEGRSRGRRADLVVGLATAFRVSWGLRR
ncbi:MAG TPA: hypothetical protein VFN44_06320, partial [Solirubrobacteraceae bacterium]|nr:hypothetical protein [Solirubrobacteraceae bacterium]